jgi:hypothetical protein
LRRARNVGRTTLSSVARKRNSLGCSFTTQQHAEEVTKWRKFQDSDMLEGAALSRPQHAEDLRDWQHSHEEN